MGICKNVERDIVNIDITAKYFGGELRPSEESTEVIWATPEEAMGLITFPLTKKRLQNMLSGREEPTLFCFQRESGFVVTEDDFFTVGERKK